MKALVYTAVKTLEMQELEKPQVNAGEVLVRVRATGICGSDVHGFLGLQKRRQPGLVLGHETMGEVEASAPGSDESLIGKRVAINPLIACHNCRACSEGRHNVCASWQLIGMDRRNGAFAEWVTLPARNVHPLPDSVSDSAAVMIEPLANAFHLINHIPAHAGLLPTAVIFGCGTLGAAILAVAKARGVKILAQIEPNPQRAQAAKDLGAPLVLNPRECDVVAEILKMTNGRGVDVAIDAVGLQATRQACAQCVTRGGTALLLGLDEDKSTFDFSDIMRREVRLQCSYCYAERDFQAAFDFVCSGSADFSRWTDVLPLEAGQCAFERLISDPQDRLKIILQP
jgi:2-desacetyl-2-hydroxyethyl bacteriochlorophyllide A dehydrogenase